MRNFKLLLLLLLSLSIITVLIFSVDNLYTSQQHTDESVTEIVTTEKFNSQKLISSSQQPYLVDGFDWSLPAKTSIEPYSGLIEEDQSDLKTIKHRFKILRWDEINPKQGDYDFSKFDSWLDKINPRKALIRLEVNSACETPQWALKKLRFSKDKSLIFWDIKYLELLNPLIQTFAKKYADNVQIAGVQLGIGDGEYNGSCEDYDNKNGWGEFWMSPDELSEAQNDFDLSPELFEQRTLEIIDIYRSSFKGNVGKLAFTNIGTLFTYGSNDAKAYNNSLLRISEYTLKNGLGNRDGQIEIWLRYLDKIYGQKLVPASDGSCKLEFDEAYADSITGRYWGTENEFYGNKEYVLNFHGPYKNQPYRFLISSLRALQMRRNFFTLNGEDFISMDDPVYQTQHFFEYLTKTLGKQKHNTADAFILLGERYITADRAKDHVDESCVKNKEKVAIRSFGRWLTESSKSQPSLKVSMPEEEKYWAQDFYLPEGIDYEYAARQATKFEFNLNDELSRQRCKNGCDVEIKVVFKDIRETTLLIRIAEGLSQSIQTLGDQKIKTASFRINSRFINGLKSSINRSHDFSIESKTEIPLILIRVNFLD